MVLMCQVNVIGLEGSGVVQGLLWSVGSVPSSGRASGQPLDLSASGQENRSLDYILNFSITL